MDGVHVKLQLFIISALGGSDLSDSRVCRLRLKKRPYFESTSRIIGSQEGLGFSGEQTGFLGESNKDSSVVQPVMQSLCRLSSSVKTYIEILSVLKYPDGCIFFVRIFSKL
jgi:hypothetical protein